jgi:hypothetical protein
MPVSMSQFAILLLSFVSTVYTQNTATLSPAAQASSATGVSNALDAAFAGFGIEPSNLFSFTGGNTANSLSVNLLKNLGDYSGIPPHMRIGGNTADQMIYDSSFNDYAIPLTVNPTGQGAEHSDKFTFGPSYFKAISRFPKGTPITFGLNLAYEAADYMDRIVAEAKACLNGLTGVELSSFEIGNEPDLYLKNAFRTGSWGGSAYAEEFLMRAAAIYKQVLKPAGISSNFFETPATASTIGTTFEINDLISAGITKGVNGSGPLVAGWNQHNYYYFVSVSTYDLTLNILMELSKTEDQFAYWVTQVNAATTSGLPYYLREMASAGPVGLPGISDTFGAALWTLNFFCYAASVGIASVQMHMTDNSYAAAWAPIEVNGAAPHVRPSYYAFAAWAQLIGSGNGTTQIAAFTPANIPTAYSTFVRTYTVYTKGDLAAVVLINSMLANSSEASRGSITFDLSLPSAKGQTLFVSTLEAAGADSTSDVTWNGISYEQNGDGTPKAVNKIVQTVSIDSDGSASVTVPDSQAVIANIGYQLGSHAVLVKSGTGSRKTSMATSTSTSSSTAALTAILTTAIALLSSLTNSPNSAPTSSSTTKTTDSSSSGSSVSTASPTKKSHATTRVFNGPLWNKLLFAFGTAVIALVQTLGTP